MRAGMRHIYGEGAIPFIQFVGDIFSSGIADSYSHIIEADNGKIYCSPWLATKFLEIDPTNDTTTLFTEEYTGSSVEGRFGKMAKATNGKIYVSPRGYSHVIEIDPVAGTSVEIGSDLGLTNTSKYPELVAHSNGKLYGTPGAATHILEVDPVLGTTTLVGDNLGTQSSKYNHLVEAPNGKLYAAPFTGGTQCMEFDPSTGITTFFGAIFPAPVDKWSQAVLANNGKIYAPPRISTDKVLVIDPVLQTATEIGDVQTTDFTNIAEGTDGRLYCPFWIGTGVLMIDPTTDIVTDTPTPLVGGANKYQIIGGNFDRLYCLSRTNPYILEIDEVTQTSNVVATNDILATSGYANMVLSSVNGAIYSPPWLGIQVLKLNIPV